MTGSLLADPTVVGVPMPMMGREDTMRMKRRRHTPE